MAALQEQLEAYIAREKSQKEVHTEAAIEPILIPSEVVPIPIVIPPPPPFYVKAIPDDLVQDSLVFKCGVLAKCHVKEEFPDTSSHSPPPLYTEVQEVILLFVYGGEGVKGGHSSWTRSLYERSMLGECFERCCPTKRLLDEWVEGWKVPSGRFKLL